MLADCTEVRECNVSVDVMKQYAGVASVVCATNPDVFYIAVLPSDSQYGMGRMWQAHADGANQRTRLVRSREEVDAYLLKKLGE